MRAKNVLLPWLLLCAGLQGQTFTQRGFVEADLFGFPQTTLNDGANVVGNALLRWDASYQPAPWFTLSGGLEAQADTHRETERAFRFDTTDRGLLRPAFSLRTLKATFHRGHFTADIGKQFIRWGKADILNPTDRFAPRDYMNVVDNGALGVLAARVNAEYHGTSVDLVWTPRFTPSRIPLIDQRWALLPPEAPPQIENAATIFPGGGQYGARINHIGRGYEVSASMFEGYNHLPLLVPITEPGVLFVQRFYPKIRTYGTDAAIPLRVVTLKTEAAWFQSRETSVNAPRSDSYVLWVAQLERQIRQWVAAAGYAGQTVFDYRYPFYFDPERGLTKTFLAKAVYNLDAPTSFSIQTATRQNGRGTWTTAEYSRQLANHWRLIGGITVIAGNRNDFLGEYHRNSFGVLRIRYSF
jgi:hypothetical protein